MKVTGADELPAGVTVNDLRLTTSCGFKQAIALNFMAHNERGRDSSFESVEFRESRGDAVLSGGAAVWSVAVSE